MHKLNSLWKILVAGAVMGVMAAAAPASAESFKDVPVKGMVTMVDLGAKTCIPCKMMEPVLEKVKKDFQGKAAVIFIDVRMYEEQIKRFEIRAIPTQVFYDAKGEEVFRHLGFFSEKDIVNQFEKMGVR
ncbi:MAG: thioredoxin family protein [Desulfobacterales bacterium]|nr:thioredoxin family protein [Desulfobacterales bacterium]MDD4071514.1 thioredoxin family protein [Desulfobacterales bacterium]MDD4391800.1 thioredoxin family protein [Desulfobacterales bacterium]